MEFNINLSVAVCVLLHSFLGFVWYAAIFTKPWLRKWVTMSDKRPDTKQIMKGMPRFYPRKILFRLDNGDRDRSVPFSSTLNIYEKTVFPRQRNRHIKTNA